MKKTKNPFLAFKQLWRFPLVICQVVKLQVYRARFIDRLLIRQTVTTRLIKIHTLYITFIIINQLVKLILRMIKSHQNLKKSCLVGKCEYFILYLHPVYFQTRTHVTSRESPPINFLTVDQCCRGCAQNESTQIKLVHELQYAFSTKSS